VGERPKSVALQIAEAIDALVCARIEQALDRLERAGDDACGSVIDPRAVEKAQKSLERALSRLPRDRPLIR
jgi:hypothetical protein